MPDLDDYIEGTFDSNNPANIDDIEVELTELEQLEQEHYKLRMKLIDMELKIRFCLDVLESPAEDNQNTVVINKLKSML